MRSAESYRAAKRLSKKALRRQQKAARPASAAATRVLGTWAAKGGTLTAGERAAVEAHARAATKEAERLTVTDVDKAMENALTAHQTAGRSDPLGLSPPFAARARALGWVENVEFMEEKAGG